VPQGDSNNPHFSLGFEALLERHLDSLYRFAMSLARNRAEAEDLLQDTALKGLQAYGRFEPGTNFRAWIFAILMNTFRSRYRKLSRDKEVPLDALPEISVGAEVFDLMLKQEVMDEVNKLPELFRAAVILVDLEGLSYREAAQAMECPQGTLMSRLNRARGLLKGQLAAIAQERGLLSMPKQAGRAHDLP
jgi:RNA polymerase sigma-70 factor (ECF subfamily)